MQEHDESKGWQKWVNVFQGYKRTIYCTKPHSRISIQGKSLIISNEVTEERVLLSVLERLVLVGKVGMAEDALLALVNKGISVDFLPRFGSSGARLVPVGLSYTPLLIKQEQFLSNELSGLPIAQEFVGAKIHNSAAVLRRRGVVLPALESLAKETVHCKSMSTLRGLEGYAARLYFACFSGLVAPFTFPCRAARPAPDPVNAMLSFGYTLLHNRVAHALEACGLNSRCGFYHIGRGRHSALASDLMEDMRFLVDRVVLSLIRRKQVEQGHFCIRGTECRIADAAIGSLLIRELEEALAVKFTSKQTRPGLPLGKPSSYNEWIMSTALAYRQMLLEGKGFTALWVR